MRPVPSLGLALLAALALAGCGRRGPLELPPGAPPQPAAQSEAQERRVFGYQGNPTLRQPVDTAGTNTQKPTDVFSEGSVPRPINAPPQQKTGFFLDPLL